MSCDGSEEDRALQRQLQVVKPVPEGAWDVSDVCAYLKMGRTWVREQVAAGKIPCVRLGRSVRFDPDTVKAWWKRQVEERR
ncbi:helix-turn-helix domain-containing protein [Corallococcus exiguus]|uniref:helix-turn-helix domain-containing protein n=1 Tax=Corallococcus exiguus TaxID=83462 RepID=UPI001475819B|nr:helix-turn-helix domain-containing protein [Corallococcus exiguus]NNB96679.1 helix-turn-helix domain-containing protein [Corallococcus exiguus]